MRTRMIESPPCIPAFVVIWCTRHSLKLIEAIYQPIKRQMVASPPPSQYIRTHLPVKKKLLLN